MGRIAAGVALCAALAFGLVGWTRDTRPDGYARMQREIAVLLCSHHWYEDGSVVHEDAEVFVRCIQTYNRTGRVP